MLAYFSVPIASGKMNTIASRKTRANSSMRLFLSKSGEGGSVFVFELFFC